MTRAKRYTYPSYRGTISVSEFRKLPKDAKIDVMRTWFGERYEDPIHNAPWVDGGYVFVNGGPFDALEELQEEFQGLVAQDTIEELAEDLSADCSDWTHARDGLDYDDYDEEFQWYQSISSKQALREFEQSISESQALLINEEVPNQQLLRLLFVSGITALETYLSDFMISIVKGQQGYLQVFVEKFEPFKHETFAVCKIFEQMSQIEKIALKKLRELMWHDLAKVSKIYHATLEIEFPQIPELFQAVAKRHDLVHRNGKTHDGDTHTLEIVHVQNVFNQATALVHEIERQWTAKHESQFFGTTEARLEQLDI